MIKINQLKVHPGFSNQDVFAKIVKTLKCQKEDVETFQIIKSSIDARKKPDIFYSLTVAVSVKNEGKLLKRFEKNNDISAYKPVNYCIPDAGDRLIPDRPVVIGSGPAGLFCSYFLAKSGYKPILLERGKCVLDRAKDIEKFWEEGVLDTESNVQFGEGGAGTFSDGKLNTLVNDKEGRNQEVLKIFVENGAPKAILYDAKPHIGTDVLIKVVASMREKIKAWGGEVFFESKVTDVLIENGTVTGVMVNQERSILSSNVVLAIGHSARDTFQMLYEKKLPMEAKSFAVGFRVMHPQKMIDLSQYGKDRGNNLPPSPYKVAGKGQNGRGVYSFCMCPGGYVVNASSEDGQTAVNGMSYAARAGEYANSAIIVAVTPKDFGSTDALAGIAFQKKIEKAAYEAGKGRIPVEYYLDFKDAKTTNLKEVTFAKDIPLKGQFETTDLRGILPAALNEAFVDGMEYFDKKIHGFGKETAIMAGVESRTSSPVRIHRDENLQSEVKGLYPCGEGAGYAGGITSAAMDGIRVFEMIRKTYKPE